MRELTGIVVSNCPLAQGMFALTLHCEHLFLDDVLAGQFVHIAIPNGDTPLRRPISIYQINRPRREITLAIQIKGVGTKRLSALRPGDSVPLLGPCGNAFSFFVPASAQTVYLVGGGVGVAPMRCALDELTTQMHVELFAGYRDQSLVYGLDGLALGQAFAVTDDGSYGEKGLVTVPLLRRIAERRPDALLACGPLPMLRAVQALAAKEGISCALSLEERMGCGLGACLVCACRIKASDGVTYRRVCADGPIFDAKEVVLDA